jgi:hypothetical protein
MVSVLRRHAAAVVFFAALFATGFALHRDFGIPWDEPIQRGYGQTVSRYIWKGDDGLFQAKDRVYGPAHELALLAFERVRGARDGPEIFAARHLFNFLTFAVALIFLYGLGLTGFRSRTASLLGCVALVLSPALFGHAFYNSKDLPFLSFFIVSAWTLIRMLERPSVTMAALHAMASGWLIDIRIPGVLVPALTVVGVAYCVARTGDARARRARLLQLGLYLVLTALVTWACWPTLWRDPLSSFWHALSTMSRYPWDENVLYAGALVPATNLPWHYAPIWIAITTPLIYLASLVLGVPAIVARLLQDWRRPEPAAGVFPLVVLAWLTLPLASVIALRSVLYDGWRQLFFIYPALLLVAMHGILVVFGAMRRGWASWLVRIAAAAAGIVAVANVAGVVRFMVEAHPHSHVYFNSLAGGVAGARFRYEMDYWGLSYREGLEAIVRHDRDALIPFFAAEPSGAWNAQALPFADRRRLLAVDAVEKAKYFLGAYRLRQTEYPYTDVVHRVEVSGVPILTVALVRPDLSLTPITAPDVTAVRERNAAETARAAKAGPLRARIEAGIRRWLESFVRNAKTLHVDIAATDEQIRQGQVERIGVRITDAEIGDFRSGRPGIPVNSLELSVRNAVLDLARMDAGDLDLAYADEVAVRDLELDAAAVNQSFEGRRDDLRHLRVSFERGSIHADWRGKPAMQAVIRVRSGPDPWRPDSENIMFDVEEFRLSGWRVPGAGLLPFLGGISSPLIGPGRVNARVVLGSVTIDGQKLRLGVK